MATDHNHKEEPLMKTLEVTTAAQPGAARDPKATAELSAAAEALAESDETHWRHFTSRSKGDGEAGGEAKVVLPAGGLKLVPPFRLLVTGASNCGKSTLIMEMLKRHKTMFAKPFTAVFYTYPAEYLFEERRKYIEDLAAIFGDKLRVVPGIPNFKDISEIPGDKLVILDDLYQDLIASRKFADIVTIGRLLCFALRHSERRPRPFPKLLRHSERPFPNSKAFAPLGAAIFLKIL